MCLEATVFVIAMKHSLLGQQKDDKNFAKHSVPGNCSAEVLARMETENLATEIWVGLGLWAVQAPPDLWGIELQSKLMSSSYCPTSIWDAQAVQELWLALSLPTPEACPLPAHLVENTLGFFFKRSGGCHSATLQAYSGTS